MSDILEGFLCPLCMKDLGDVIQLQVHFEENHAKEDPAFVQSLKDLFGRAKKKILSDEEENFDSVALSTKVEVTRQDDNIHPVSGIRTDIHQPALFHPLPANSSHFATFKKLRSDRVDRYAAETNRLIVRLDRLLESMPSDASKRRDHEQTVVQWVEEDLVKLCPNCAKNFNIARRKHHCRLCGSVMCKECSKFVEWDFCRKLINPSTLSIYSMKSRERQGWSVNGKSDTRSNGPTSRLKRSGSKESLHSMLTLADNKTAEEFRTCDYCLKLLQHRDAAIELQTVKPIISQFYDKLRLYMEEGTTLSEKYLEITDSLSNGETNYHLADAKDLRLKLLKLAESVDLMSKKIAALGTESQSEAYASSRKFFLQTQIRRASVNLIKETLVGLPSPPTDEQIIELQKKRKEEVAKKVEEERRKYQEARLKFKNFQEKRQEAPKNKLRHSASDQAIMYEKGFVLSTADRDEFEIGASDDPMVQQMNIIRSYITQARDANRFDEVRLLETNLQHLRAEYAKSEASNTHNQYESFNLNASESSENLADRTAITPGCQESPVRLVPSDSGHQGERNTVTDEFTTTLPAPTSGTPTTRGDGSSKPPVLEEMARTVNTVRDYLPKKALFNSLNPFGTSASEDEYDASGKNPFSE